MKTRSDLEVVVLMSAGIVAGGESLARFHGRSANIFVDPSIFERTWHQMTSSLASFPGPAQFSVASKCRQHTHDTGIRTQSLGMGLTMLGTSAEREQSYDVEQDMQLSTAYTPWLSVALLLSCR